MQVFFESRDPDGAQLRELAVQRLRFVLRRLIPLVPRARVRLVDVNGPRGGIDKQCQIELSTAGAGRVLITAMATDWRTALDSVLARAPRVVMRQWHRARPPLRDTPWRSLTTPVLAQQGTAPR